MENTTLTGSPVQVILSEGMGVESTSILVRWMLEPETCPCPLSDLLVITAQVGDEFPDTGALMEAHILPLMRQHRIRYVQVARSGHLEEDGITVLSDTRTPDKMYLDGVYKLSDEMRINGTVPQYSGVHKCALKFKAFVIEQWLASFFVSSTPNTLGDSAPAATGTLYGAPAGPRVVRHAIGYNADEVSRVENSEYAFAARDAARKAAGGVQTMRVAFGFNAEETGRIERTNEYDGLRGGKPAGAGLVVLNGCASDSLPESFERVAFYPLLEWGWNRQRCLDYLHEKLGVKWPKSCCTYCPFACNKQNLPDLRARHKEHPVKVADAMLMEHLSLAMNPRGTVYSGKSLIDLNVLSGNTAAVEQYQRLLAQSEWALYRVRRLYNAKKDEAGRAIAGKRGTVNRAVEKTEVYATKAAAEAALQSIVRTLQTETLETARGIPYGYVERRGESYPTREEYWTIAPALVETKAAHGIPWFDGLWNEDRQQNLFHEAEDDEQRKRFAA